MSHALRGSGGARGRMGLRSTVQTAVGQSPLSLTRRMAHRLRAKVLIHETDLGALCPLGNRKPDMWIATRRIRTRGGSKGEGLIWLPRRFRNHPTSVFLNTIYPHATGDNCQVRLAISFSHRSRRARPPLAARRSSRARHDHTQRRPTRRVKTTHSTSCDASLSHLNTTL